MTKKRGLGKGLSALIPAGSNEEGAERSEDLREIPLEQIVPNPNQPRQRVDEKNLAELVESIKIHGLIQPIVVRPGPKGVFEIIAGERRWLACKELHMKRVPAIIKRYSDLEASAAALIENIQREDLNAVDEASAYQKLMDNHGLTQEELSARLGKSRSFIANMVRLLALPGDIKELLAEGKLTTGHARALLSLPDDMVKNKLAARIIEKQMNVRSTEDMVRKYLESRMRSGEKSKPRSRTKKEWEEKLATCLGRRINIREKADGSGMLVIRYDNREDLQKLMHQLTTN